MTNKNLYLIGTVHTDLEGPKRLSGLLESISPDILALEFHKDREPLFEQKKIVNQEKDEKELGDMFKEAGLSLTPEQKKVITDAGNEIASVGGYEYRASKEYVLANPKSRLEYIDISLFENGYQELRGGYLASVKSLFAAIAKNPELREPFLETLSRGKDAILEQSQESVEMFYENLDMVEDLIEFLRDPKTSESAKERLTPAQIQMFQQIYSPKRDKFMAARINDLYNRASNKVVAVTGLFHIPGLEFRLSDLEPTVLTLADYDLIPGNY